ncbi:hypothetical protein M501DRAFT_940573 [Patellaria atrata CBS 101060]|uniref:RNA polymerase II subunit B1 CTD phosphatase RPAP2 homolog n=1 Tax=Patellaria atrata CBS 101060 TaxID=1346257 RepID=A0A9P4S535_9PEZI|nr:hypothetical protein M501DRAFT_940573 [Patellaria atrata CBS 101060]
MPPKSILKNSTGGATENSVAISADNRDPRKLEIAVQHATRIQQQKNYETLIFEAIEALLDFPQSPNADPARPSPEDASRFTSLILPFQPGDYDSMMEERHCADLCGYAMCPRAPKRTPNSGTHVIIPGRGGQSLKVITKKEAEQWCSPDCAKRAMYVKVQLSEKPAWERRAGAAPKITLLVDAPRISMTLPIRSKVPMTTAVVRDQAIHTAMADLELERGDKATSTRPTGLISSDVVEKDVVRPASPPRVDIDANGDDHMAIDGYKPRTEHHSQSHFDNNYDVLRDWNT